MALNRDGRIGQRPGDVLAHTARRLLLIPAVVALVVLAGQPPLAADPADQNTSGQFRHNRNCNDTIKRSFKPDRLTTVLKVKLFRAGDRVALENSTASPVPPTAPVDVCLVKLLVGPGNPGTPGAPSTSPGIGIEVWLPTSAHWNDIIRSYGSGGWAGGFHADPTRIGDFGIGDATHLGR